MIELIKLHQWMFRRKHVVDYVRFDDGEIARHLANLFERQQRMAQVIEHAQEEDDVERSESLFRNFVNAQLMKFSARTERVEGLEEIRGPHAVPRRDPRAVAFSFKAVKPVPAADV